MPNHVTTRCTVTGDADQITSFKELMIRPAAPDESEPTFDFGAIIPMPEYIRNTRCGGIVQYVDASISDYQDQANTARPLTEEELTQGAGEGWYDWSIRCWGTKWNSYSFSVLGEAPLEFTFDTAWSFPTPLFERLAERFPALHFECACFDEGWGFAGDGFFNPPEGEIEFMADAATDRLYEKVYGEKPERDEDDEAA